ncbi:MAG: MlaD family protein [Actinomycetota bacterium]
MGKQFIERSPVIIGIITAALIVGALFVSLGVTREDLTGGYKLTMEFADANGLAAGDIAIVAGIQAGRVLEVDIVEDHVEAIVQMDGGVELPEGTRASITVRTLVGKKAIDLDTGISDAAFQGPLLQDGDRITIENTRVTIDVPQLAESAEDLLTEIDSDALNTLLVAVADVTRDQRDEVSRLVDSGTDLTELVNSQEQQIRLLLRNLSTLSQTLESRDDELVGIIDDLDLALGNIAARRADLQDLLRETQTTGAVTADFLARVRGDLDAVLDELHLDLEIVRRHQVDLAEGLAYSGDALNGYASIGFAGDQPVDWGHVFVTSAGPVGLDVLVGCGGLIDQQLDAILGPDPRTCEEQGVTGTPGTQDPPPPEGEDSGALIPILPDLIGGGGAVIVRAPQELGIDVGPRSLMHMLEGASQ